MASSALRDELIHRFDELEPNEQRRVLDFVQALEMTRPRGMSGAEFVARFAGMLDPQSADEMLKAIEEGCEVVDVHGW